MDTRVPNDPEGAGTAANASAVQLWRWRFQRPGPHLTAALAVGEMLKSAATRISCRDGSGLLPEEVYRDGAHGHAFWLPGDEDDDGYIDHAWVYCERGLPSQVIAAFAGLSFVRIGGERHDIAPDWMSPRLGGGPFGPARVWRGLTPYVTPKWRLSKTGRERASFTPDAQLLSEIAQRGLPAVASVTWEATAWIGDMPVMASSFLTVRRKSGTGAQPPSDAVASFPNITFTEPVLGPLSFGFGAHFGLGQLVPVE